jgi:hypothetical protein
MHPLSVFSPRFASAARARTSLGASAVVEATKLAMGGTSHGR